MPFQGQWSDSLFAFERVHLLRLAVWAVVSIVAGSSLLAWIRLRHVHSPLLDQFAIQSVAWGAINLSLSLWSRRGLVLRDLAAATALDRSVWFSAGLNLGFVALGAVLACIGWALGRRLALVGAGLGIVVQGLALFVLYLQFTAALVR